MASASKDDNTVALYLNREGFAKRVVSSERKGAYGLAAADVDQDGRVDLVVASNGDNTVSWYRNVGNGSWEYREIYTDAIFVLSVTPCVEIKILRRVRAESSRRPPRHRRDACSMAWRCRFLAARWSQHGRVIVKK